MLEDQVQSVENQTWVIQQAQHVDIGKRILQPVQIQNDIGCRIPGRWVCKEVDQIAFEITGDIIGVEIRSRNPVLGLDQRCNILESSIIAQHAQVIGQRQVNGDAKLYLGNE